MPSGFNIPPEYIRTYCCYDRPPVFPESAIPADVSRQNYSVMPRPYYVDMLKGCRKCERDFIFFAREQQYWYEELGFCIDADCVHCPECRRSIRQLRQVFQRFSRLIGRGIDGDLSEQELVTLLEDAVFLWEAGVLSNEHKLRRLKNLAKARIAESEATTAIDRLVMSIEAARTNPQTGA